LPGALHLDHQQVYDAATNKLKSEAELAGLFAGLPDKPIVSFCNTGHQAAPSWFVLSEILHRPATLYDGSMSEWTEDDNRPVEVG
jgi:thiosulfate/3-mercaptopyruvate sulfurtransferase